MQISSYFLLPKVEHFFNQVFKFEIFWIEPKLPNGWLSIQYWQAKGVSLEREKNKLKFGFFRLSAVAMEETCPNSKTAKGFPSFIHFSTNKTKESILMLRSCSCLFLISLILSTKEGSKEREESEERLKKKWQSKQICASHYHLNGIKL